MPCDMRISLSTGLPQRRGHKPVRWLCPMNNWVTPRDLAKFHNCVNWIVPFKNLDTGASLLCDRQFLVENALISLRNLRLIDIGDDEFAMKSVSDDLSGLEHFRHVCARCYTHQNSFVSAEMLVDALPLQILGKLMVDDIGSKHQRHLPQL